MANFPWAAILAFIIISAFSFVLFQVGDLGLEVAGTETLEQQNETLVVSYSNDVHVSKSTQNDRYTQGFNDSETIINSSGTTLVEGTDYEWNTTDGGVTFFDTANTTDGENVNITYFYDYNVEEVRESEPVLRVLVESVPLWVWIPAIIFFIGIMLWGWSMVSDAFSTSPAMRGGR